jgi:hypothetical protein
MSVSYGNNSLFNVYHILKTFVFLRGPNGVWTLEEKGLKPEVNISFDEAVPTKTHMAILKLVESGKLQ